MDKQLENFFREVAIRINSDLDLAKAIKTAYEYMQKHIPMDIMGMYHLTDYGKNGARLYSVACHGHDNLEIDYAKPGTPILWLSQQERNSSRWLESEHSGDIKIVKGSQLPSALLKVFNVKDCSVIKMKLESRENNKCTVAIAKKGQNVFSDNHVQLLKSVCKPFSLAMQNALRYHELMQLKEKLASENLEMKKDLKQSFNETIIGADSGLKDVMQMVSTVATTASPVLLFGETGTGKEVIARAIHNKSPRHDQPFISVHCGAIPENLANSELFGHEKGSFTGAIASKKGKFERAEKGTIFLDEIGELSLETQVKLLRVLQEKEFERVGGQKTLKTDVRIITATHRDLPAMVKQGLFREDLWFRLNVFPVVIPPLRHRKEDIPALVDFFIQKKSSELGLAGKKKLIEGTEKMLYDYSWPGNIRELQNLVERALITSHDQYISIFPEQISISQNKPGIATNKPVSFEKAVKKVLADAVEVTKGQIQGKGGAAELLELNPSTLRSKLRKYNIPFRK